MYANVQALIKSVKEKEVGLKCITPFMHARVTTVTAGQPVAYACDKNSKEQRNICLLVVICKCRQ